MTDDIHELLADARRRLQGAPREALGTLRTPRFRQPRILRAGSAWHLGVLLLDDDAVHRTGDVLRAVDPGRRGYTAESARIRAELRAAALRGGFDEGEIVHVGWAPIEIDALSSDTSPLRRGGDGGYEVRWTPSGGHMPLKAYLDERVALLVDPPVGA